MLRVWRLATKTPPADRPAGLKCHLSYATKLRQAPASVADAKNGSAPSDEQTLPPRKWTIWWLETMVQALVSDSYRCQIPMPAS
jgi:hypothetical protein